MKFVILFFFLPFLLASQVNLTQSNLPIVVINTQGQEIQQEPKINAFMGIIDNPNGINKINDPFNDFEGKIGIEYRGQSSFDLFPKKAFGIEIRDENDEDIEKSIMGFPKESDFVLHNPYSDKSLMRNALLYILAGQIMEYAPKVRFCEVIVNNEYLGVYLLTEKIKRDNNRVDIRKLEENDNSGPALEGGYIIKFDKFTEWEEVLWESNNSRFIASEPKYYEITSQQRNYIKNYITNFENALKSPDFSQGGKHYSEYIDRQSFIDFMLLNEFSKNVDGYRISSFMYKDSADVLKMGPVWDFNLAFGNADYCEGGETFGWEWDFNSICGGDFWNNAFWWKRFLQDSNFSSALVSRWDELKVDKLSVERAHFIIDSIVLELGPATARNFQKWPVLGQYIWPNRYVGQTYEQEIVYLKGWINDRFDFINSNMIYLNTRPEIKLDFGLFPNPTSGFVNLGLKNYTYSALDLIIFDVTGAEVLTKDLKFYTGESFELDILPGLYFYALQAEDGSLLTETKKLIKH